jgi:Fe-S-cluster-containing hydrogenase component 2
MKVLKIDMSRCDAGRDCHHECEEACAVKVFKFDDPERAALHIREAADGHGVAFICDQCGDCVEVCPTNALTRNRMGVVVIDKKICVGCMMCIGFCDKDIFERAPGVVEPYKCISCGICVKVCPHAALEIVDVPAATKPTTAAATANAEERV